MQFDYHFNVKIKAVRAQEDLPAQKTPKFVCFKKSKFLLFLFAIPFAIIKVNLVKTMEKI